MIRQLDAAQDERLSPTLWGLTPLQLHDRFWAARGVQVVRQGEPAPLMTNAELFLLTDQATLSIFRLGKLVDTLSWLKPRVLFIRLHSTLERGYRELVLTDDQDRFVGFKRIYNDSDSRLARVAITPDRHLAEQWQQTSDSCTGWRDLRRSIDRRQRTAVSLEAAVYDRSYEPEVVQFMRHLVQTWRRPDATISRIRSVEEHVWTDAQTPSQDAAPPRFIGPVWIGAGRHITGTESVVGPAVLWDDPEARPGVEELRWDQIEPTAVLNRPPRIVHLNRMQRISKRLFDIVFSLMALAITLPFYPLVMLVIWIEDGRPFFFFHRRETVGGREFPCIKFRSMKTNAEQVKADLVAQNRADGPQFFIEHDPRLTRIGSFLRTTSLDELPQFINVLLGHMSVVGPRPSPRDENQYCPPWREARLSVRPGITGLWQVKRSRAEGLDFQEWIRYDLEYVENVSWRLDLWIIGRTLLHMLRLDK